MNAYRLCIIVLSLVVLFSMSGCTNKAEEPAKPEAPKPAVETKKGEPEKTTSAYQAPTPGEGQPAIMADVGKLMEAWIAQPTDFKVLAERYQPNLAKYIQESDKRHGTSLDQEITKSLKEGAEGKYVSGNRQIVQKGLQMAFIMNFEGGVKAIDEGKTDADTLALVEEAAPAIKMIAGRRDKSLERGTEYQDAFTAILGKLLSAAKSGDKAAAKTSSQELLAFTTKIILLSVLHEVNGLEKSRGKGAETVATKFEECRMYYRSLKDEHKKRNAEGAAAVQAQFAKQPEEVDTDLIQKILAADFKQELAGVDPAKLGM